MYILVISRGFPSNKYPLLGNFEIDQARALSDLGHKVVVASIGGSFKFWKNSFISKLSEGNIVSYRICLPIQLTKLTWKLFHYLGTKALVYLYKKILEEQGSPDIAHAHYLKLASIGTVLKKKYSLPFICTEHWSVLNSDSINKNIKKYGHNAYSNADCVITVSTALATRIKQHFNYEVKVIPNIVDSKTFSFKERSHTDNSFIFISVGGLIHRKGFDLLINAFKKADIKDSLLYIIGEGELYGELENQIKRLNLEDKVFLLGLKKRDEIAELMRKSDVFVLPSRAETFGVVYIEAMMVGLPVIASVCGGPEEFINETNGLLIPVNDENSLIIALKQMRDQISFFDRKKISDQCEEQFSPKRIATQLITVYSTCLKKNIPENVDRYDD